MRPVPAGRGWDALARPRCTRLEDRMEMYWPGEASLDLKEDDCPGSCVKKEEGVFPASSNQATLEERLQLTGQGYFEGTGSCCHPGKIRQTTWISQKSLLLMTGLDHLNLPE